MPERERYGEESGVVRWQCLKYIYIYLHIQRERGERCGALSVLEVYTYIYIFIQQERYSKRERDGEESGVVRWQCLEERESARGTCTNQQDSDPHRILAVPTGLA